MRPIKFVIYEGGRHWSVFVEERGEGSWAITSMEGTMSRDGAWEYELSPSNRTDEYKKNHRYSSPEEARDTFEKFKAAYLVYIGQ